MARRLLVLGAGSGTSNSLIRSLRRADPAPLIVGCHDDRFVLKKSLADRNYLIPRDTHRQYAQRLCDVATRENIDLLIPNSDAEVDVVGRLRRRLPCRTFLPRRAVIELCRDKYDLTAFLHARRLPVPATYPVNGTGGVAELFRRLAPHSRLWCRIRDGAGSMGATSVKTPAQARGWIRYWAEMRGIPPTAFTISEYLPGRDFACQSLWQDGRLILIKTAERLSYFGGWNRASGVSSIAALAKTVFEPRVAEVCTRAIAALDPRVSGALSVDLKENASGVPCVTEINAGRFITMLNLFDFTGKHNMSSTYVRLALGEPVDVSEPYDVAEDYYFVRDVDTVPGVFHADELFHGIRDARS
jgi:glutathione synthase/RimK-type ligase-like ATP-grasp enzyme